MKKVNKRNIITFIIILMITCTIYAPLLMGHYATDTYNIINKGYEKYAITYSLNDGRPIMCIITLISQKLNMPIMLYVVSLTGIALIISSISVIKLKNTILKYTEKTDKKTECIILAISYIIIFNFAYLENLQFAESAIMSVSILMSIISAQIVVEKNRNYILKGLILSIISVIFYQGTINWLFTITFVLSLFKEKNINKQVIKNLILSGIFGGIGCVVDLIQIKITGQIFNLSQTRTGSFENIPSNFRYILKNMNEVLLNTYNLFPKNMLYIYLVILLIYALVLMVKDYNLSPMFGEGYTTHANMMIDDKQIFEVTSKHKCQCLYTPGHTLGSCCYYFAEEGWLFSGDTLFAGSVGRSDFPTGDAQALLKSLNHVVMRLPDEVIVYPGHGPSTTIGEERETNPFVER